MKYRKCDCWAAESLPEIRDELYNLKVAYLKLHRDFSKLKAQNDITEAKRVAQYNARPSKIQRQTARIRELEEQLRLVSENLRKVTQEA